MKSFLKDISQTICLHNTFDTTPTLSSIIRPALICTTRGVLHCGLAIYIKKYLKAKEELWKLKYFTMQKYINLQKNPLKETKTLQDIITL